MGKPVATVILFVFNTLFFVCGLLLVSFGAAGIADPSGVATFISNVPGVQSMTMIISIPEVIVNSAVFMIVLGSILVVFGFLGCFGAWCKAKPLLFLYWLLLLILLIAEVALIIYAAISPEKAQSQIQTMMINSLHEKFEPVSMNAEMKTVTLPSNLVSLSWVSMQFEVPCCGVYNSSDYDGFNWNNTFHVEQSAGSIVSVNAVVPPSCCKQTGDSKQVPKQTTQFLDLYGCLTGTKDFYDVGCYHSVTALARQYSYIPIGITCCVIIFEIICIAAAIHLWRTEKKDIS